MTQPLPKRSLNPSLLGAGAALLATLALTIGTIGYFVVQVFRPSPLPQVPAQSNTQPNSQAGSSVGLAVPHFDWKTLPQGRNLVGTVKNQSYRSYAYVKVEFDLLDDQGQKVGDAMAIVSGLEPQKTGEFEAPVVFDRAVKAQIRAINGF
ncbi:MAG: FxLYD domain-containing protein [Leptolyngbyaceae cyanobacterium bins.59]|nr:FxLYD domain-containing protein [Leptolyngbyaceae cyanobacterium bins.59]